MSPISIKKFRFSDAVYVVETTPKSLRKWLQDPEMKLVFSGQEEGWREFSFADLAVLATMRKMVDFGLTVDEANAFANTLIMSHGMLLFTYRSTPPQALVQAFKGVRAILWRKDQSDDPWMQRIDGYGVEREAPASAYVVIDVFKVLSRALARVVEITGDESFPRIEYGAPAPILSVEGSPTRLGRNADELRKAAAEQEAKKPK